MSNNIDLLSLDETLENLNSVEKKYDESIRIKQTKKAIQLNEKTATDKNLLNSYCDDLAKRGLFVEMYGYGEAPWAPPVHVPSYLMEILNASAKVLLAQARNHLKKDGPDYLINRMPKGWLTDEMADLLFDYFLKFEPDMAFDVLIYGANTKRGMTFEEFKNSNDHLYAKIIEAQSVDTYYGWLRECMQAARNTYDLNDAVFTMSKNKNIALSAKALDDQIRSTYMYGFEDNPNEILFLEIDPQKGACYQNLDLLSDFISQQNKSKRPHILDPQNLIFKGNDLYTNYNGKQNLIKKVISRIVDPDLQGFIKRMEEQNKKDSIELLRKIYALPSLWTDLSKHLAGYYLIDKSSVIEFSQLEDVGIVPKTFIINDEILNKYRKNPELLKQITIKPLNGMSSKGVFVTPELPTVEKFCKEETMLAQNLIWATPIMPNVNPEIDDPDVDAGICSEIRLVYHAGSNAISQSPYNSRCVFALSRTHYTSKDPARKILNDPKGRGWFSNIGAIMAVRKELNLMHKRDACLGMGPVCWEKNEN